MWDLGDPEEDGHLGPLFDVLPGDDLPESLTLGEVDDFTPVQDPRVTTVDSGEGNIKETPLNSLPPYMTLKSPWWRNPGQLDVEHGSSWGVFDCFFLRSSL